jgi:tetratricopeptide (TPR) repeat protein
MTIELERYRLVVALEDSGKIKEALAELHKLAITSNSPEENAFVYTGMVRCLIKLGRNDEARDCVNLAYTLFEPDDPQCAYILFADATIEDALGHFGPALTKLDLILQKYSTVVASPDYENLNVSLQGLRGMFLVELKKFSEARPMLELAVNKGYWKERTLYYLGACCCRIGDLEAAEKYLKEALELDLTPGYCLFTHYHLGMTYIWQGNSAWAKQEFEWCLDHLHQGELRKEYVLNGLIKTSEALGHKEDARRYSAMLG